MIPDDVRQWIQQLVWDAEQNELPDITKEQLYCVGEWLDSQPTAPEPDWSQAPPNAKWYTVDSRGERCWWVLDEAPYIEPRQHFWTCKHGLGYAHWIDRIDLPICVDWRTTLRKRPEATE